MALKKVQPKADKITEALESARREVKYVVTDFSVELIVQKYKQDNPAEGTFMSLTIKESSVD